MNTPLLSAKHTNSSAKAYRTFFHDIVDNLTQDEINNLVTGSDEEKSFKLAIERCLSGATHTLCTRHLRKIQVSTWRTKLCTRDWNDNK